MLHSCSMVIRSSFNIQKLLYSSFVCFPLKHIKSTYFQTRYNPIENYSRSGFICFYESFSKLMKNPFYFMLKALNFCHELFRHVRKRLNKKVRINFKMYNVTDWGTNNGNILIAHYLKGKGNQTMIFCNPLKCNMQNIFFEK